MSKRAVGWDSRKRVKAFTQSPFDLGIERLGLVPDLAFLSVVKGTGYSVGTKDISFFLV
jgi:hypothetical protein